MQVGILIEIKRNLMAERDFINVLGAWKNNVEAMKKVGDYTQKANNRIKVSVLAKFI